MGQVSWTSHKDKSGVLTAWLSGTHQEHQRHQRHQEDQRHQAHQAHQLMASPVNVGGRISASIDPLKSGTVRGRLIAKNSENIRVL